MGRRNTAKMWRGHLLRLAMQSSNLLRDAVNELTIYRQRAVHIHDQMLEAVRTESGNFKLDHSDKLYSTQLLPASWYSHEQQHQEKKQLWPGLTGSEPQL